MLNAYRKQNFPGNPTSLKTPLTRANSNHSPCRNFLSSTLNLHLHFNHETCPAQFGPNIRLSIIRFSAGCFSPERGSQVLCSKTGSVPFVLFFSENHRCSENHRPPTPQQRSGTAVVRQQTGPPRNPTGDANHKIWPYQKMACPGYRLASQHVTKRVQET